MSAPPKPKQSIPEQSIPEPPPLFDEGFVPVNVNDGGEVPPELFSSKIEEEKVKEEFNAASWKDWQALKNHALALEKQIKLPEAGAVAYSYLYGANDLFISVTARAPSVAQALNDLVEGISIAQYQNPGLELTTKIPDWARRDNKKGESVPVSVNPLPGHPSGAKTPQTPDTPQGKSEVPREYSNNGTVPVERIVVSPSPLDGKLEVSFTLGGFFRFPVKDRRGASIVAQIFDEELGWETAHFNQSAVYEGKDFDPPLFADYVRVEKQGKTYYNIVRVHA